VVSYSELICCRLKNYIKLYHGKIVSASYHVNHMERSKSHPNTMLYSDGSALLKFDFSTKYFGQKGDVVAGWPTTHGYKNGAGKNAQFFYITGFVQLNQQYTVAVDNANHCLRLIDTRSGATQRFAGTCGEGTGKGYADGDRLNSARFEFPQKIIIMGNYYYITDELNNAIRSLRIGHGMVNTVIKGSSWLPHPRGLVGDSAQRYLYVTIRHGIIRVDPNTGGTEIISASLSRGWGDGSFSSARFNYPAELVFLAKDILVVADEKNYLLRILNLKTKKVSSVCNGVKQLATGTGGSDCSLNDARAVLFLGRFLYTGEWTAIRRFEVSNPKPVDTIFG